MTDILFEYDHILIRSEYRTPEKHSHLAAHLIVSLGDILTCEVFGEKFHADGVLPCVRNAQATPLLTTVTSSSPK